MANEFVSLTVSLLPGETEELVPSHCLPILNVSTLLLTSYIFVLVVIYFLCHTLRVKSVKSVKVFVKMWTIHECPNKSKPF